MKIEVGQDVSKLTGETDAVQAILNCAIKGARQLAEEVDEREYPDLKGEALSLAELCESLVAEIDEEEERREKAAKQLAGKPKGSTQNELVFS